MPFAATCPCGATFNLKDEYAGALLKCPTCQGEFVAQAPPAMARVAQADEAFDRDKFLLRQKVVSINEKYDVMDEQNRPIVFVERPAKLLQNLGALLAALVAWLVVTGGIIVAAVAIVGDNPQGTQETILVVAIIAGLVLGILAAIVVGIVLSAKRHVMFYRDASRSEKLLDVLQDAKFQPINATYTVRDREGQVLCKFRKNIIYNLIRKRWYCFGADGATLMYVAREDSMILSLLRRFLGPLFGLLRTNYIIQPAGSEEIIGEFNRKFTLFDRYVLDLSADPSRTLDRRVALAMGVMLDTGERR